MYQTNQTRHGICPIFSILIKLICWERWLEKNWENVGKMKNNWEKWSKVAWELLYWHQQLDWVGIVIVNQDDWSVEGKVQNARSQRKLSRALLTDCFGALSRFSQKGVKLNRPPEYHKVQNIKMLLLFVVDCSSLSRLILKNKKISFMLIQN